MEGRGKQRDNKQEIVYVPFIRHGPHGKRRVQFLYFARVFFSLKTCLRSCCLATDPLSSNDSGDTPADTQRK
jgi:hypothetical protein